MDGGDGSIDCIMCSLYKPLQLKSLFNRFYEGFINRMTRTIDITSTYCLENSKNNKWNNTLKTYNNNLHGLVSILEILDSSCNDFHCLH